MKVFDDVVVPATFIALIVAWAMIWFHNGKKAGIRRAERTAINEGAAIYSLNPKTGVSTFSYRSSNIIVNVYCNELGHVKSENGSLKQ